MSIKCHVFANSLQKLDQILNPFNESFLTILSEIKSANLGLVKLNFDIKVKCSDSITIAYLKSDKSNLRALGIIYDNDKFMTFEECSPDKLLIIYHYLPMFLDSAIENLVKSTSWAQRYISGKIIRPLKK